jgi:hypothetical protein
MAEKPKWKVGDEIKRGDIIGIMGTTGQSTANHLHIDCVVGVQNKPYKLGDIGTRFAPDQKQLAYFIDAELFGVDPVITTGFLDPEYKKTYNKDHPAYDVVPKDRERWVNGKLTGTKDHFAIHWNRSMIGTVELVVYQPESYGNCIYVSFETKDRT